MAGAFPLAGKVDGVAGDRGSLAAVACVIGERLGAKVGTNTNLLTVFSRDDVLLLDAPVITFLLSAAFVLTLRDVWRTAVTPIIFRICRATENGSYATGTTLLSCSSSSVFTLPASANGGAAFVMAVLAAVARFL